MGEAADPRFIGAVDELLARVRWVVEVNLSFAHPRQSPTREVVTDPTMGGAVCDAARTAPRDDRPRKHVRDLMEDRLRSPEVPNATAATCWQRRTYGRAPLTSRNC